MNELMNTTSLSAWCDENILESSFNAISSRFEIYHQNPWNVFFHFVTTPLGLLGLFGVIRYTTKSSSFLFTLNLFYLLTLLPLVPNGVFFGTAFLCLLTAYIACRMEFNILASISLVVSGYILQDLAHMGTGEKTFQSSYSSSSHEIDLNYNWFKSLMEQNYYLLPLCVHVALPILKFPDDWKTLLYSPIPSEMQRVHTFAWLLSPLLIFVFGSYCLDSKNMFCFFPGAPYFYRVLQCSLLKDDSKAIDLKNIRDWVIIGNPSENSSSHFWYKNLPPEIMHAFDSCANAPQIFKMFRSLFSLRHYCVEVVKGMNEIYVTGPSRKDEGPNSDQIFYSRHVDGPFGFIPFVSVYRCIVGMDKNHLITTHFPLANLAVNACEGDVLAFDFNREVHYISSDESKRNISDDFRVTLKLHYCVYPRILAPLGWLMHFLNVKYNQLFRALFLKTINPVSLYEHFLAWNVTTNTDFYDRLETYFGVRNILYLLFTCSLWWATHSYTTFFVLTSFVHYVRYISTFYVRRGIDFGSFKRDVLLFKTLALGQIFYHYVFPTTIPFEFDSISIVMIIVGYTVSVMATNAIGIDRTYFAAELGLVEPKWINKFPYGYIPHPMIVSQIFALLGFMKARHFRSEWPFLIPIHILFYVVHMLQEHFDVYKKYPIKSSR